MTLEILICTIDDGIQKVANVLMPPTTDIIYLISWEQSADKAISSIPDALKRDDVRIVVLKDKGLSRNRNNAIKNAVGDICLIADDDLKYDVKKVLPILGIFEEHPTLDLATFKHNTNSTYKDYPSYSFDLRHRPSHYFPCSIEIAFRRNSVQNKIEFNELLGLGAPVLGAGEDEVFILEALKHGLNCKYFPMFIVTHAHQSTYSTRAADASIIKSRGMLLHIYYPGSYFLHYIVAAYRLRMQYRVSFFKSIKYMMSGYEYAKHHGMLDYNISDME